MSKDIQRLRVSYRGTFVELCGVFPDILSRFRDTLTLLDEFLNRLPASAEPNTFPVFAFSEVENLSQPLVLQSKSFSSMPSIITEPPSTSSAKRRRRRRKNSISTPSKPSTKGSYVSPPLVSPSTRRGIPIELLTEEEKAARGLAAENVFKYSKSSLGTRSTKEVPVRKTVKTIRRESPVRPPSTASTPATLVPPRQAVKPPPTPLPQYTIVRPDDFVIHFDKFLQDNPEEKKKFLEVWKRNRPLLGRDAAWLKFSKYFIEAHALGTPVGKILKEMSQMKL